MLSCLCRFPSWHWWTREPAFEVSFNENLLVWTQSWAVARVGWSSGFFFLTCGTWAPRCPWHAVNFLLFHRTSCFIFLCLYGSPCPEVAPFQLDLPEAKVAVLECFTIDGLFRNRVWTVTSCLGIPETSDDLEVSATVSAKPNADGTVDIELVTETFFAFFVSHLVTSIQPLLIIRF